MWRFTSRCINSPSFFARIEALQPNQIAHGSVASFLEIFFRWFFSPYLDMKILQNPIRILFVDDNAGSLSNLHELLSRTDIKNFSLECVTTYIGALSIFIHREHDVCLIDSPGGNAAVLLAEVRRLGCSFPVVVLTSDSATEVLTAMHNGAADCIIRGGLTPALLERTLCEVIDGQRKTESRRAHELRYLSLVEHANEIIYTHDLSGDYILVNRASENLTGYKTEEALGMNVLQMIAPEYRNTVKETLNSMLEQQTSASYECELLTKNGGRLPVEIDAHLIYENGRPVAMQGIARDISSHKEKHSALRANEERFRAFVAQSSEAIWCLELPESCPISLPPNRQIEIFYRAAYLAECNDRMAQRFGFSRAEEAVGTPLRILLPASVPGNVSYLEAFIASGHRLTDAESRERDSDGNTRWFLNNLIGVIEDGCLKRAWGTQREITGGKQAETALRESEERYHDLVELSPDAIIVHSEGLITFINTAGARLLGAASPTQVIGRSFFDFVDATDLEILHARSVRTLKGEPPSSIELKCKGVDGSQVFAESMSVPFIYGDRSAVQMVIRDISERKRAEAALGEANRRALIEYEKLLERIAALGQTLGQARYLETILRAVRNFAELSVPCDGMLISLYDQEKGTRKPVYCWADQKEWDIGDLDKIPVREGVTGRALKSGSIVIENEYQKTLSPDSITIGECKEGTIPQSALSSPMAVMGRIVGCIEIQSYQINAYSEEHATAMRMAANLAANAVENIALIQRAREKAEQLRQAQKMEAVGQLAGGVAHDFNNLLTAIFGYSELSLKRLPKGDDLRKNMEEIKKACGRATSLTRQLLAFSRKQMLQAKVIDLNTIVADIDKMLRRLIGEDIDLVSVLDPIPCKIKGDAGQIEQVIMNLAVNARDAMPRGGKLTIETGQVLLDQSSAEKHVIVKSGPYAMLAVSDTGCGMDRDTRRRIFEPFFTTKEMGKGTGLGLSTVYGIVKQSEGTICVYSEPGQGSTFKIYLPLVEEVVEANEFRAEPTELVWGQETILLVEDEEIVRDLTSQILEMSGYQVLVAVNGEDACRVCREHTGDIHLMLTDVVMPQMSGRELAERVELMRPEILVLYMSGYTDDAIVRHGVLEKDMPFLQKPFTPDSLTLKVRNVLKQEITVNA